MIFLYSLKLFRSNWCKALKFFLYIFVIWGICLTLFLPCFFAFKDIFASSFADISMACYGIFAKGSVGEGIRGLTQEGYQLFADIFAKNIGLAVYGIIVIFVLLPLLFNLGKFAYCQTVHAYMSSKSKIGFCSALVKNLNKSLPYALCKTFLNLFFFAICLGALYGFALISNKTFVVYVLPLVETIVLIFLFSLYHLLTLGWIPAQIVFGCNVFSAMHKGWKAVARHFWATFGTTILHYAIFFALVLVFGVYTMIVLVPFVSALLNVFNMTAFFISQGMRFYYDDKSILTPKKLEEVDNINKTAFIL